MCDTLFFLTTDGYTSKPNISELTQEFEKMVKDVSSVPHCPGNPADLPEVTVIDFMAYARKAPIKNLRKTIW